MSLKYQVVLNRQEQGQEHDRGALGAPTVNILRPNGRACVRCRVGEMPRPHGGAAEAGKRIGLLDALEPILANPSFLRALVMDTRKADCAKRLCFLVRVCKTTAHLCTTTTNPPIGPLGAHIHIHT